MFKRVKRGDTLVEVALAVGVFSMVAVAVTAVLNGSTSGAQTALETTTTREEIDTQAEALRFIQTAYAISRNDTKDNKYRELWKEITSKAIENVSGKSSADQDKILNYTPTTCSELYNSSNPYYGHMFILNPRKLSNFTKSTVNEVLLATDSGKLKAATINPRLVYSGSTAAANAEDQDRLVDTNTSDALLRAEGIFIVPVKDAKSTMITDVVDGKSSKESAYYDFYIRSCWYGTGADHPSMISTLVRLYDPDVMQGGGTVTVIYPGAFANTSDAQAYNYMGYRGITYPTSGQQGPYRKVVLREVSAPLGWTFNWRDSSGETFSSGAAITNDVVGTNKIYNLYANYTHTKYTVKYDLNYPYTADTSAMQPGNLTCYQDIGCTLASATSPKAITSSGYKIKGWCTVKPATNASCSGTKYNLGQTLPAGTSFPTSLFSEANRSKTLYAIWSDNNENLKVQLTWGGEYRDLDSYMTGQKSDGSYFTAYYGSKVGSDTSGLTIAQLDHDCTGSCKNETFELNTLGGKNYYYSVRNYSADASINASNVLVVVSRKNASGSFEEIARYTANNASGTGRVWNVFAYKDGAIVPRNTRTASAETSY